MWDSQKPNTCIPHYYAPFYLGLFLAINSVFYITNRQIYHFFNFIFFNLVSFWGFYWIFLSLISHSFLKMTNVSKVFLDVDGVVFWMDGCVWAKRVSVCFQVGLDVWTGLCEALAARGMNFYSPHGSFTRLLTSGQDVKCFPTLHATMSAFIVPFFDWRWEEHRIFADGKVHRCLSLKVVYLSQRVTLRDPDFQMLATKRP